MNIHETRPNEYQQLCEWITECQTAQRHFNIIGISGYGGIGKTYLLNMVLDALQPQDAFQSLVLRVDGSNRAILGNFAAMLNVCFAPLQLPPPAREGYDYFPKTRKLIALHDAMSREFEKELAKKAPDENIKRTAEKLYNMGAVLNKVSQRFREYIDFEELQEQHLEDYVEPAFDLLNDLQSLKHSAWIPTVVKDFFGIAEKERILNDLFGMAADCLYRDYSSIFTAGTNYQNLLMILDDFEILGKTLTEFLVTNFAAILLHAHFRTTLIISGRDELDDVSVEFQQYLRPNIKGKLRLAVFPEEVARKLLTSNGYTDDEALDMYCQTGGYPFLITLLAESKNRAVSFYQRFYERTTKWMTPEEKSWLVPLCYLDEINQCSIQAMLPDVNPETVIHWFQKEASVRDMSMPVYCVNPFIRNMLLEYNKLTIGNKAHQALIARGKQAVEASHVIC